MSSAIEVLKKFRYTDENVSINQLHNALDVALLALEKQEKQLYCAYEQGYEGLDFYGFFLNDKEALIGLKKEIKNSYTHDSEYRFFKLDFSKEGVSTSLPVKEVLGELK